MQNSKAYYPGWETKARAQPQCSVMQNSNPMQNRNTKKYKTEMQTAKQNSKAYYPGWETKARAPPQCSVMQNSNPMQNSNA